MAAVRAAAPTARAHPGASPNRQQLEVVSGLRAWFPRVSAAVTHHFVKRRPAQTTADEKTRQHVGGVLEDQTPFGHGRLRADTSSSQALTQQGPMFASGHDEGHSITRQRCRDMFARDGRNFCVGFVELDTMVGHWPPLWRY